MVDGDVAALSYVFEGDGATDACGAAGYGGGFGGEEVVRHGFWRGRLGRYIYISYKVVCSAGLQATSVEFLILKKTTRTIRC